MSKKFFDIKIQTKDAELCGDFTEEEMLEIQAQMLDKNTDEIVMGNFREKKCNIKDISISKEEYVDD